MGAPVSAPLPRRVRRGFPSLLIVALAAGVASFAPVGVRMAASQTTETTTDNAAAIEPPASRPPVSGEDTARPAESARPAVSRPSAVPPRPTDARGNAAANRGMAKEMPRPVTKPTASPMAAVAPAAEPASKATPPAAPSVSDSVLGVGAKLLLGSLVLAGLLYGASRVLKRMPIARLLPNADGPIKVIGRTHLGPKASLALIQADGATILVAVTAQGVQALHTWTAGGTGAAAPERPGYKASPATPSLPVAPGQLRGLQNRLGETR